jgi:hypothetical protein
MVSNPTAAPILFDRALLRARQARAMRSGPATFLLDRVAEDMAERLPAVLREFKDAADIGTAGDQVRNALAGRVEHLAWVDLPDVESEPLPLRFARPPKKSSDKRPQSTACCLVTKRASMSVWFNLPDFE